MSRHEKHCTANPSRICGMCGGNIGMIPDFISVLGKGDEEGVDRLREAANGCPACMLSAIRQSHLQTGPDDEGWGFRIPFNFHKEKDAWWAVVNDEKYRHNYY
jgi:hypothetical protein